MGLRTHIPRFRRTRAPLTRRDQLHTALGLWAIGMIGLLYAIAGFTAEPPTAPLVLAPRTAAEAATATPAAPAPKSGSRFERETEQKFTDLKTIIEDPSFDRLDGKGKSRKRVDVIEWEGNLEIHVYPAKSLQGLALKIDDRNSKRPVMVIGYRFENAPKRQLIRRALLGLALRKGFKAYRDPAGGTEYDKIVISQSTLPKPLEEFKLDPEPDRLYPDGHPLNEAPESSTPAGTPEPQPMSDARERSRPGFKPARFPSNVSPDAESDSDAAAGTIDEDTGSIRPFRW